MRPSVNCIQYTGQTCQNEYTRPTYQNEKSKTVIILSINRGAFFPIDLKKRQK